MYSYLFVVKNSHKTSATLCRYFRLPLSLTEIDSLQVDDNQRGMNSCAAICTMDKSGQT